MKSTETARTPHPKHGKRAALVNGSSPQKNPSGKKAAEKPDGISPDSYARQSESTLRALIEHAKDALILFDRSGKALVFNQAAKALYQKHNNTELETGISIYELITEDRHEPTKEIFTNILRGETFERVAESTFDGKKYYFRRYFHPVNDEDGNVYAVANTITDITGEVEAKEAISRSEATLRTILESTNDSWRSMI